MFAFCSSPDKRIKNCSIQYTKSSSYSNLSFPITGLVDVHFPLFLWERAVYYHQASAIINATLEVVVQSMGVVNTANIETSSYYTDTENTTSVFSTAHTLGTTTLKNYVLGLIAAVIAVLLLTLVFSIGINVIFTVKGTLLLNLSL